MTIGINLLCIEAVSNNLTQPFQFDLFQLRQRKQLTTSNSIEFNFATKFDGSGGQANAEIIIIIFFFSTPEIFNDLNYNIFFHEYIELFLFSTK